ncbi:hypothetical protein PR048_007867 [Dryococelus australis]|uniref:Uncharacterized protein n=1 Tax=Dryococelus australis TaxID=614101 RepID=A0ABQ9HVG3_9NEOP|nr:hypothetical protein PR048_007867 [Dryococelus australis]
MPPAGPYRRSKRRHLGKRAAASACSAYTVSLLASHSSGPGSITRPGHSWIFAGGNRAFRCRWLAGFLGDLPFPPPLNSGAGPFSPHCTLISSQDLVVKSHPNLSNFRVFEVIVRLFVLAFGLEPRVDFFRTVRHPEDAC